MVKDLFGAGPVGFAGWSHRLERAVARRSPDSVHSAGVDRLGDLPMQSLTHVHGDANAEILFLIDGVAQSLVESDVLREPLVRIEPKTHTRPRSRAMRSACASNIRPRPLPL